MKTVTKILITVILSSFILSTNLMAQKGNGNEKITDHQKLEIIDTAMAQLKENYVFPERIPAIESFIKKKFGSNGYSSAQTLFDFLEILNQDFEAAGNDHHLDIFYSPEYVAKIRASDSSTSQAKAAVPAEFIAMVNYENFFLKKVERLDGNIGYFKFNKFEQLQFSKTAIVGAMNFISNSSAIIVDLTQNGGGSAETVHFLMNYFLPDSTKLGTFKRRKNNEVIDLQTEKDPLINKISDSVPLYIIVSKNTSSAAEAFAYGLQQFKRATIVGEQTLGEGNPGARFVINDKLYMMIPTATNVNIKTGTSWEGTGVTPDIRINPSKAFAKAIVEICQVLSRTGKNDIYKWMIPEYEAQLNPELPPPGFVTSIVGDYDEGKKIGQENGSVFLISASGKRQLTYMGNRTFLVDGRKDYRISFPKMDKIMYAEILWSDGSVDKLKKVDAIVR